MSELNPGWRFERDDDGATIVSPNATRSGAQDGEAYYQLRRYADTTGGDKAFGPSTGFTMSTGSHRQRTDGPTSATIDMYAREGARYAVALDPKARTTYERRDAPAGLTLDAEAIYDA